VAGEQQDGEGEVDDGDERSGSHREHARPDTGRQVPSDVLVEALDAVADQCKLAGGLT
jgi:hypothetical protein